MSMRFYRLKQEDRIRNIATMAEPLNVYGIWESDAGRFYPYKVASPSEKIHFLPFIERPMFMVTEKTRGVFDIYQANIEYKPFGLGDLNARSLMVYFFMRPPKNDCLSDKTEFYSNRDAKNLVLDANKIGYDKVFQINELRANYLIVALDVVEALLMQNMNEFKFIEVEVE